MYRAFLAAGMCALALFTGPTLLTAQDRAKPRPDHDHGQMVAEKTAAVAGECQRICDMCSVHCARMVAEGKKEHLTTLQTCQDCATVCAATAAITARNGPFSDTILKACAEACARCGAECEKFPSDPHMKQCAEVCRKCEKACREALGHVGQKK
jgi:hypothetical protein